MSYTKKNDYRRQFKNMNLQELKDILPHLQKDYDKWFILDISDNMEIANKSYRTLLYVKNKINKLTNKGV